MKLCAVLLCAVSFAPASSIPTVAGVFSIAASSTQIVKETHNLIRHPIRTIKGHGKALKQAASGKDTKK